MNIGGGENEFRFDFQKNDSSPNTDKNPDSAPMFNGASAPFASSSNKTVSKTLIIYILCFVLIIAAIIFAKLFKRHSYKR